jgi:tetratricopeptide (TPR) repeat protein
MIGNCTLRQRLASTRSRRSDHALYSIALSLALIAGCSGGHDSEHSITSPASNQSDPATAKEESQKALKRGSDAFDKSQFKLAIAECTKAIELDPKCAKAYFVRGQATYHFLMDWNAMIADDTRAIQLDQAWGSPYASRADGYRLDRQYEKAIVDYTDAIRRAVTPKTEASCYYGRGLCYAALREHQKAIDDYTEAARLDPKFSGAFHERGMSYKELGEKDKSDADLKHAADLGYAK